MHQKITEYLHETYGENFIQLGAPVGLIHKIYGKKLPVECQSFKIGNNDHFLNNLKELTEKYDPSKYICAFYKITEYTSPDAIQKLIRIYYKDGQRIPEVNITNEIVNSFCDSYSIRCAFLSLEDYEKVPTCIYYTDVLSCFERISFYRYWDDSVYKKNLQKENDRLEELDQYSLTPICKESLLFKRIGFITQQYDDSYKKSELETKIGESFIEWIPNISLRIYTRKDKKGNPVFMVSENSSENSSENFAIANSQELLNDSVKERFTSYEDFKKFVRKNAVLDTSHSMTVEEFAFKHDVKEVSVLDWYAYNKLMSANENYTAQDIENVNLSNIQRIHDVNNNKDGKY